MTRPLLYVYFPAARTEKRCNGLLAWMSFKAVAFPDARIDVPEHPRWLVNRLVVCNALSLLAGDPKAGKSELTYQLAVSVATGQPFLGFETRQAGVLLVVAEEAKAGAIQRLLHFRLTDDQGARVFLWTDNVRDSTNHRAEMGQFLQANPDIKLVIIDTLASYFLLTDETDNSNITERLKPYMDLAHHTDLAVLVIHHQRKNRDEQTHGDTRDVRGGTAITSIVDVIYQLKRPHGGSLTQRTLKLTSRFREMPSGLRLDYPQYPDGGYVCQAVIETTASHSHSNRSPFTPESSLEPSDVG